MSKKKQYSDEFKREAIRLQASSGKSVAEVERELGLSHNLLRQWKRNQGVYGALRIHAAQNSVLARMLSALDNLPLNSSQIAIDSRSYGESNSFS